MSYWQTHTPNREDYLDPKVLDELEQILKEEREREETCIAQRFFSTPDEYGKLPKSGMISCPCKRCNPYTL